MPGTPVIFYQASVGSQPPIELWLASLPKKVRAKCLKWLELLEEQGADLRRPIAAPLRDGIYELRFKYGHVNYRMLYFFHGRQAAVVSHGCTKEKEVPAAEIDIALAHKHNFKSNPNRHTYRPPARKAKK